LLAQVAFFNNLQRPYLNSCIANKFGLEKCKIPKYYVLYVKKMK
jgi:hypothetical protein